jgi:competence protein ComEC
VALEEAGRAVAVHIGHLSLEFPLWLGSEASRSAGRRIGACLTADRDRWVLWLPVGLGTGIGLYFALPTEPPLLVGPAIIVAVLALGFLGAGPGERRRAGVQIFALTIGVVSAGFTIAQLRTGMVAAPTLTNRLGPTLVEGRVVRLETLPGGARLTLDRLRIASLDEDQTPARVRVRFRGEQQSLHPGDQIQMRAVLNPPPPPASPGAFDFQRQSFFESLGAVGFAVSTATIVTKEEVSGITSLSIWLAGLRMIVAERVHDQLNGATGAVVVALLTGERGAIPKPVMTAIRDSGLAHLLAISGLHIGLIAGFLFVSIRGLLALVPPLVLRYPIKKWAALSSILGAGGYVLLAGATVPSQRAFLMIGFVLLAVMMDRRGLSMRLIAWAALVMLLVQPESLLGASFQLSFSAVVALVAVFEVVREVRPLRSEPPTFLGRILLYLGGVALTTVVAGLATAPLALFYFNRLADYGVAANLLAVPVTAMWIMPWALVALLLMPLGLSGLALTPMGWGVDVVIWAAEGVASWPGAVTLLPTMPNWALILVALGGLWLCLWRGGWRLWGLVGVVAGLLTLLFIDSPDVLVDGRGKLVAVRGASGNLAVSTLRSAAFTRESWLRRGGQESAPPLWPRDGFSNDGQIACDILGCIYRTNGHTVALVRSLVALSEDCRVANVVISTVPVRGTCPAAQTIVDRFDLWRSGAHAIWLKQGRVHVESVNGVRGNRPWVLQPRPQKVGK